MQNHRWRSKVLLPERGWLGEALSAHGVDPIIVPDHQRARYLAGIISTVRRHRVDLIHAHLLGPASYASIAGLACKIPVVCTFHGHTDIQPDSIRERVRTALIGRAARRVVSIGRTGTGGIRRTWCFSRLEKFRVPHSVTRLIP
jgi:glycosyltransferase involved in cell wall biosynthesis